MWFRSSRPHVGSSASNQCTIAARCSQEHIRDAQKATFNQHRLFI